MGVVYLAEQEEPVRRTVALKLIKAGMDTDQVVARFESERQALALMSHPNIARVYDAGATEQGRPYFVMEYVPGEPITRYCDSRRLTTNQRLELFIQVCEGVQHAHHRGTIHRDVKPSNVLVAVEDEGAVPKIIDFGVARATEHRLTERSVFTQAGVLIGTPEYMSPEQAEMSGLDVDTRTDVYSLGVLLYELLVGALPFDPRELREAGLDEIRRRIREEEPSKPSTRLSTLGDRSKASAEQRRTDPASLARDLRGDLDWISMKALEKDRSRRYGSPNELGADIRRHLKNEPVLAGPPSATYRLRKFVQRHKIGTGFSLALALLLLSFAVTMAVQARRITKERDRANLAAERASREAAAAEQVSEFLVEMFTASDTQLKGETITARELLEQGAERIDEELQDQPLVQARLMETIGAVYRSLSLHAQARPLLERSLEIRLELLGEQDPEVAESLLSLAGLELREGEYEAAGPLLERALAINEEILGPDHPAVADCLAALAVYRHDETSRELYERALAIREKANGPDDPDSAWIIYNLGMTYENDRDYESAREHYERSLAIWEKALGPDQPNLAPIDSLGRLAKNRGDFETAWGFYQRGLETSKRVNGLVYTGTAAGLYNVADLFGKLGQYERARRYYELSLDLQRRISGAGHYRSAAVREKLAQVHWKTGDYESARTHYEHALQAKERRFGPDDPRVAKTLNLLGQLHTESGEYARAKPLLERGLDIYERARGPEHDDVAWSLINLSLAVDGTGDPERALELMERGMSMREAVVGPDDLRVAWGLGRFADLLRDNGDFARAADLVERALVIREAAHEPGHPEITESLLQLAKLRALLGERTEAIRFLRRAVKLGYADRSIARDPDLRSLRGEPEFDAIVEDLMARPRSDQDWRPEVTVARPMTARQLDEADRLLHEWREELARDGNDPQRR
jgi:non-specific serine/threonine protein kinase/serine/threonine-protein kinase